MKTPNIAITNAAPLNGGDAAILYACHLILRRACPGLENIPVFSSAANVARKYYCDLDLYELPIERSRKTFEGRLVSAALGRFGRWRNTLGAKALINGHQSLGQLLIDQHTRRFVKMLPRLNMLCANGGTYITEAYGWRHRIVAVELARAFNVPVVFMPQSMYVESGKRRLNHLRRVLPQVQLFLVRDCKSAEFLQRMGVAPERVHRVHDAAFIFANPDLLTGTARRTISPRLHVAVSVRDWGHFTKLTPRNGMENYLTSLAAALTWLVRAKEAQITFLSTCQGVAEYPFIDSKTAERAVKMLPEDVKKWTNINSEFHDARELPGLYEQFDFVIATRFHVAILALGAGVPVLPIAYEFKTRELFESFGMREYLTDINNIQPESFSLTVKQFVDDIARVTKVLHENTLQAHYSALSASDIIRDSFKLAPELDSENCGPDQVK